MVTSPRGVLTTNWATGERWSVEDTPMDRSGFSLSSAHSAREQDMCTSTPNDILHDSAARAKYTRTHDRVCPTTIIAVIGQTG
jgi:hypothetical protein